MLWWETLSDSQLLEVPLKELDLVIDDSIYLKLITKIKKEIHLKGIKLRPNFWISNEFFVCDGGTGIALPFYLMHPRLTKLEKKFIGHAEGESQKEFCEILRHEYAHAIDNAYYLRRSKRRRDLFGKSTISYPKSYLPRTNNNEFVEHLCEGYAQSHPDEDFAETFAVWLKGGYKKKYITGKVATKLSLMDELMNSIAKTKPKKINQKISDSIDEMDMTLGEYLKAKAKDLKLKKRRDFFITMEHKAPLNIVKKSKKEIIKNVSTYSKENEYIVEKFLNDYLNLGSSAEDLEIQGDVSIVLSESIESYRLKNLHRIIM
jgi:hypothetical protein